MKKQILTPRLKAINELRKMVYFLAENIDIHSLWSVRAKARIEHLEMRGSSNKECIINLLIDSQKHSTLNEFIDGIVENAIVGNGFIDLDSFRAVNYELPEIEYISFDVSRDSYCHLKDTADGLIYHNPSIKMKAHEKYKCRYIKYCAICGEKLGTETIHKWGDWHYVSEDSCNQKKVCANCDESETRIYHEWSKWTSNKNGSRFRVCKHCGKEEFDIDGLWSGFVYWNNGSKDYWELTIKTSGIFWETTKAEIKVYVNVTDDHHCEFIILQTAKVEVKDRKIIIKGKKIVSTTNKQKKYNTDCFIGEISQKCQFIEGSVSDSSLTGILKLCF